MQFSKAFLILKKKKKSFEILVVDVLVEYRKSIPKIQESVKPLRTVTCRLNINRVLNGKKGMNDRLNLHKKIS